MVELVATFGPTRRRPGAGRRAVSLLLGLLLAVGVVAATARSARAADGSPSASGSASVAASAASVEAPSASGSSWAYDLAGELMSPFCPGRTLASCPSPQAGELIQWIATQEAAGVSRDEVIAILVERHGEEILGAPPAKGITLWAYVFPVLGFVAFGGIAVLVLRRLVAGNGAGGANAAASGSVPTSGQPLGTTSRPATPVGGSAGSASAPARRDGRTAVSDELARIVDAELADRA